MVNPPINTHPSENLGPQESKLGDSKYLDDLARDLKGLAAECHASLTGPNPLPGEFARWMAIARTNLQNAGMWAGKLRMIANLDPYPYPESTDPSSGKTIAKPIHADGTYAVQWIGADKDPLPHMLLPSDKQVFAKDPEEVKDFDSFSWGEVEQIKGIRKALGQFITDFTKEADGFLPGSGLQNILYMHYLGEQVILMEHARHALGMVLGEIFRDRQSDQG